MPRKTSRRSVLGFWKAEWTLFTLHKGHLHHLTFAIIATFAALPALLTLIGLFRPSIPTDAFAYAVMLTVTLWNGLALLSRTVMERQAVGIEAQYLEEHRQLIGDRPPRELMSLALPKGRFNRTAAAA